jgi:hypothetical protein
LKKNQKTFANLAAALLQRGRQPATFLASLFKNTLSLAGVAPQIPTLHDAAH